MPSTNTRTHSFTPCTHPLYRNSRRRSDAASLLLDIVQFGRVELLLHFLSDFVINRGYISRLFVGHISGLMTASVFVFESESYDAYHALDALISRE